MTLRNLKNNGHLICLSTVLLFNPALSFSQTQQNQQQELNRAGAAVYTSIILCRAALQALSATEFTKIVDTTLETVEQTHPKYLPALGLSARTVNGDTCEISFVDKNDLESRKNSFATIDRFRKMDHIEEMCDYISNTEYVVDEICSASGEAGYRLSMRYSPPEDIPFRFNIDVIYLSPPVAMPD